MSTSDHYATLGVLPDAHPVVIKAAYRALAQRYHPDKWAGDSAEAHRRMAQINEAYRVLGDEVLRTAYDASRKGEPRAEYQSAEPNDYKEAFDTALSELEERWLLAAEIFPDLLDLRQSLTRISKPLAFTFATFLLETRQFSLRKQIAATLERKFLERYFGTNDSILAYAKDLVLSGHKVLPIC